MIRQFNHFYKKILLTIRTQGSFGRNLAITAFGNGFGYTIGLLLTPIIARIYEPSAYGQFALFNTMVANLALIATLNYHSAFVLTKTRSELSHLLKLTVAIVLMVSVLTLLVFFIWGGSIMAFFKAPGLVKWALFIPIIVFFVGINRCLEYSNVHEKKFPKNAKAKMSTVISAKVFTIGAGLLTKGQPIGLIVGELISKPLGSILLYSKSFLASLVSPSSRSQIINAGMEYRNYPGYILPANLIQAISKQLPIYLLSFYFGSQITGWFSLANTTLNLPILLMGTSAAYVFYQKAAETYHEKPQNLAALSNKLFNSLSFLGILPFSVLFVFGDVLFRVILGDNWETAGKLASYLSLFGYMQFISLSIGSLFRILRKERLQFQLNLAGAIILTLGLFFGLSLNDYTALVIIFSGIGVLFELVIVSVVFSNIGFSPWYVIQRTLGYFVVVAGILYFIRWWWG